jgi:hypothetical protein
VEYPHSHHIRRTLWQEYYPHLKTKRSSKQIPASITIDTKTINASKIYPNQEITMEEGFMMHP